jgi:endonuclease YncB( thermonuclease family)
VRIPGAVIAFVIIAAVVVGVFLVVDAGGLPVGWQPAAAPPTVAEPDADQPVPAAATSATIEYVHDGDTLFLTDGTKVRLLGIDTPEIGENLECYGDEATALLRSLLPEGTAVRVLADVQPLDQYGRSLLFIYTEAGDLVNLTMIEQGAAEAVVLEPNLLFADELEAAEDSAQASGVGMWGAC